MQDIRNNPNLPWDYYRLSYNKNLTCDFIKDNIEKPWNWWLISRNPTLTIEFIEKNINLFDFMWVSYNTFEKENYSPYRFSECRKEKTISNLRIFEEELIKITWHPSRFMTWCLDDEEKQDLL